MLQGWRFTARSNILQIQWQQLDCQNNEEEETGMQIVSIQQVLVGFLTIRKGASYFVILNCSQSHPSPIMTSYSANKLPS